MLFRQILSVFEKDLRVEFRSKYALNMVSAFIVAALLLVLFTLRAQELQPTPKSGLIWIIVLFASLTVLGRSFTIETDKGTFSNPSDLLQCNYDLSRKIFIQFGVQSIDLPTQF